MKLPLYDTPQVRQQGIPDALVSTRAPEPAWEGTAQGLLHMAGAVNQFRAEADTLRAEEAFNRMREQQQTLGWGEDGAFKKEGANAFNGKKPLSQDYLERYDAAARQISGGLANENQREIFNRAAARGRIEFGGHLQRHEAAQGEVYRKSVVEGVIAAETDHAGRNFSDPDSVAQSVQRVKANVALAARSAGMAADQAQMAEMEAVSGIHSTVLGRMLEANDPKGAKLYFETNKDSITARDGAKLRGLIERDTRNMEVGEAVDGVWAQHGPKDDTEAVNLDTMNAALRQRFAKDPDAQKLAMGLMRERAQERDYSVRQREDAVAGGIWKQVMAGQGLGSIRRSQEWRSLDGTKQAQLETKIEAFQKRGGEGDNMAQFAEYWARVSDPAALARMTDAQIFALAPKMGKSLTKQLLLKKAELGRGGAEVQDATVDTDSFNFFARQAGLTVDKPSSSDKAVLGELKYRAEQTIDQEQRAKGRKLTRDEKDVITKRLLLKVPITTPGRWWGTNTKEQFLFELRDPRDLDQSIVLDPKKAEGLVDDLLAAGVRPTKERLREAYALKYGKEK